uniref:Uncharacterized protein n=2 Tax=Sexangularia sp. CB-2014 TaxID=1486929 RepID=A0A7S1YA84_9EUKA|mmetsp:Transcript_12818/g.40479  ORF Transcript_12818/g.40479 Transcript_12818/m.40479 type:complete len:518 (+) Transcript_12818:446-1999(+)|eukprot:CAMPEP_0170747462 /NCGR_PEP_ID=MMETSP0437-20130122/9332_1 /TAXON_ID=0 /ORGANISM="Sexangularia sp." /LENGTH=517 /DNA_ID=CAMNT_0011086235 /DNA_START=432 /DNA_END=1985 /DNA_ORIENTATION=+
MNGLVLSLILVLVYVDRRAYFKYLAPTDKVQAAEAANMSLEEFERRGRWATAGSTILAKAGDILAYFAAASLSTAIHASIGITSNVLGHWVYTLVLIFSSVILITFFKYGLAHRVGRMRKSLEEHFVKPIDTKVLTHVELVDWEDTERSKKADLLSVETWKLFGTLLGGELTWMSALALQSAANVTFLERESASVDGVTPAELAEFLWTYAAAVTVMAAVAIVLITRTEHLRRVEKNEQASIAELASDVSLDHVVSETKELLVAAGAIIAALAIRAAAIATYVIEGDPQDPLGLFAYFGVALVVSVIVILVLEYFAMLSEHLVHKKQAEAEAEDAAKDDEPTDELVVHQTSRDVLALTAFNELYSRIIALIEKGVAFITGNAFGSAVSIAVSSLIATDDRAAQLTAQYVWAVVATLIWLTIIPVAKAKFEGLYTESASARAAGTGMASTTGAGVTSDLAPEGSGEAGTVEAVSPAAAAVVAADAATEAEADASVESVPATVDPPKPKPTNDGEGGGD